MQHHGTSYSNTISQHPLEFCIKLAYPEASTTFKIQIEFWLLQLHLVPKMIEGCTLWNTVTAYVCLSLEKRRKCSFITDWAQRVNKQLIEYGNSTDPEGSLSLSAFCCLTQSYHSLTGTSAHLGFTVSMATVSTP